MNSFEKIVINVGVGKKRSMPGFEDKIIKEIIRDVSFLSSQKPAARAAKKSIANFKTRTGDIVGLQVTLRGLKMKSFLSKLINVVFPRVKDFRGIYLRNIDEYGNLNFGFKDQFVFPEINMERSNVQFGLQITIVPVEKDRASAIKLFRSVGMPLQEK